MTSTIIFDFDGTIVNSRGLMVEFYNELAHKYNYKIIEEEEIEYLSSLSIADRCKVLKVPLYRVPQLGMYAKNRYQKVIESLKANEGMHNFIYKLKEKGFTLSIISSNLEPSIRTFLENNNMDVFDHVYSAKNFFGKHHTINAFLKKTKTSRDEAIYIGDELRDIEACRKSNIRIISVAWGFDSAELLSKASPDYLVHHPEEILKAIGELNRKLHA
ncbi:HAD-IA family hydrolase [Paenibacillus sp. SN-8-1]|uniref:HAD-IA family hydrolase n=1 Tax=Paenibacillus sp. SN-8-1 TaxID=3435409 RepID=UPI003D9A5026